MTRRRKILLAIAGALVLPIAVLALYLAFSDLSGWRDTVARAASKGMARELTIAGEFQVDLGIVTRVHATEVSLANTSWGSEPRMASIDRLDGEINLWELFSGSIHLPSVDIEGGRAIFESDAEAGSNWRLGSGDGTGGGGPGPAADRQHPRAKMSIWSSGRPRTHPTGISRWRPSTARETSRATTGSRVPAPCATDFEISGEFGSFQSLINLMPVKHDLELQLGRDAPHQFGENRRDRQLERSRSPGEGRDPNPRRALCGVRAPCNRHPCVYRRGNHDHGPPV